MNLDPVKLIANVMVCSACRINESAAYMETAKIVHDQVMETKVNSVGLLVECECDTCKNRFKGAIKNRSIACSVQKWMARKALGLEVDA